jgi:hypothetical protein
MGNKKHKCHIFLTRHLFIEIWDDSLITDETLKDTLNTKPVFDINSEIIINFDWTINIKSKVYTQNDIENHRI